MFRNLFDNVISKKHFEELKKGASNGDLESMTEYGRLLCNLDGFYVDDPSRLVEPDLFKGENLLRKAADRGYAPAMGALAVCLLGQYNEREAKILAAQAKEGGDPRGMFVYGYLTGDEVSLDMAANKGYFGGEFLGVDTIADIYKEGTHGINQNEEKASKYLVMAAKKGIIYLYEYSDFRYGLAYSNDEEYGKACFDYLSNYSNKDVPFLEREALAGLGILHFRGFGTPIDEKKAFECFEKATRDGTSGPIFGLAALAACYDEGVGVARNKHKRRELEKVAKGTSAPVKHEKKDAKSEFRSIYSLMLYVHSSLELAKDLRNFV